MSSRSAGDKAKGLSTVAPDKAEARVLETFVSKPDIFVSVWTASIELEIDSLTAVPDEQFLETKFQMIS